MIALVGYDVFGLVRINLLIFELTEMYYPTVCEVRLYSNKYNYMKQDYVYAKQTQPYINGA